MAFRIMLFLALTMGLGLTIYKYYKTLISKFVYIGWGIFVLDLICVCIEKDSPFIGSFVSNLGIGLIIYVIPIGFYYFKRLCKSAKVKGNTQAIIEDTREWLIVLCCILVLVFTTPINQCFEKIAKSISSEYGEQKNKEDREKEISSLKFDREWSFKSEAQLAVLKCLKAPDTAKFDAAGGTCFFNGDSNEWVYMGYVSSQNSFGALLTEQFFVIFSPDGRYLEKIVFKNSIVPVHKQVNDWYKWGPKLNALESKTVE